MKIKLKDEALNKVLDAIENIGFETDGCACGTFGYKLDDNLFLYVYRSCRKSGSTPNEKLWHIYGIDFYNKGEIIWDEFNGQKYVSDYAVEDDNYISGARLDKFQETEIMQKLKDVTREIWGSEFRGGM